MIFRRLRTAVFILCIVTAVSCSLKSEDKAFVSEMDAVDALIAQGDTPAALKELSKAEKKAFNSFSYIGIYGRYNQLGENRRAENILLLGIKKNPHNEELNAVYTHFLLRQNRLEESLPFAEKLTGTRYASLYSEAVIQKTLSDNAEAGAFLAEAYIPIFKAAYETSLNSSWLKNCAVIFCINKKGKDAVALQPENMFTAQDAFFWGLVQYDNMSFLSAVQNFTLAQNLISVSLQKDKNFSEAQISSLKADSLLEMGEFDSAEQERKYLLSLVDKSGRQEFLPYVYVNSAFWAVSNNDPNLRYTMLLRAVSVFPDCIPALAAYGNFAYESSLPRNEDFYESSLRSAGLKTLEMEKYDVLPRASLADAFARMDDCIAKTQDASLVVMRKILQYKAHPVSDQEKLADMWNMLETASTGTNMYPPEIAHYALYTLLSVKKYADAEDFYIKYITARYGFALQTDFYIEMLENKKKLDSWECEYGAYFLLQKKYITQALQLYEYIIQSCPGYYADAVSPAGFPAAMNLAMLYSSTGAKQKALDLYSEKAGTAESNVKKAEVLYRIACIENGMNRTADSLRMLDYCVSLNPLHEKAQLLLMQLRGK